MRAYIKMGNGMRFVLAAIAALSALLIGFSHASAETQKIRLAHSYIAAVPAVLREKGFLEKALEGRNVEAVGFFDFALWSIHCGHRAHSRNIEPVSALVNP